MTSEPIFVLSNARTGSTLLRYVMDSHPDVCAPPEIALGRICRDLTYTLSVLLSGSDTKPGAADISRMVRRHVDQFMDEYCRTKGKTVWCEKSTNNIEHLSAIDAVFPGARFICLHRNCFDVVYSLLDLFQHGYTGRYAELVARSPHDILGAMIESWLETTSAILDFETEHAARCVRVAYEQVVSRPADVFRDVFAFMNLPFDPSMLDRVFTTDHDRGPGDMKIQFTDDFKRDRVGRGSKLPRGRIPDEQIARINALHRRLDYPLVTNQATAIEKILTSGERVSKSVEAGWWG